MIDIDWLRTQNAPVWAIHLAKEIQELQGHSQQLFARVGLPHPGSVNPTPDAAVPDPTVSSVRDGEHPDPTETTPPDQADAPQVEDPGESPKTTTPTTE